MNINKRSLPLLKSFKSIQEAAQLAADNGELSQVNINVNKPADNTASKSTKKTILNKT